MALSILDGNQSATTLSTILSSGQHITAHTVVSLGTQAITDMRGAVSGSVVSISNLPSTQTIAGTVTVGNSVTIGSALDALNDYALNYNNAWPIVYANTHGGDPLPISGTVSLGIQQSDDTDPNIKFLPIGFAQSDGGGQLDLWTGVKQTNPLPVYFPSNNPLPAGTNRIGVVTIGAGTVTLGAGTAQIGSVTASISNSVVTFYPMQGTAVSLTTFNSTTSSTTLVSAIANREVLTVFNEGAGQLFISPGATATTISYQVRLSSGDYWECPAGQLSLAHTAVFATAGTARVTQVS